MFISWLPYRVINALGRFFGVLIYYLHRSFQKKAMTNLAIAYGNSKSEKEKRQIAKGSFQSLTITCLEFFRLKRSKGKLSEIVTIDGGSEILDFLKRGQGAVFLTGHQANWEIPFVALTDIVSGIAIGRPIKNRRLYNWILSVREMNGGKIVMPKTAIGQGLKALREGKFIGIVGDQAFPESSYSYPLFGTRAWTTTTPALLAYRTQTPLIVGMTKRIKGRYHISASPIIWPDVTKPLKEEVCRMMNEAMGYLEESIKKRPHEWLWQHDRWKQQGIDHVKRKYRFGFVLIILPPNAKPYLELLPLFREIYPRGFLSFLVPQGVTLDLADVETYEYRSENELLLSDWRYQIVLDFYGSSRVRSHYKKRGAFQVLTLEKMKQVSHERENLGSIIKKTLVKAECL